jgi:regulator of cell morphogenesis and NO signaling
LEAAPELSGEWHEGEPGWENTPMAVVVDHVLKVHHVYTRDQLNLIEKLLEDIEKTGAPMEPEVAFLRGFFPDMARDLRDHMRQEEEVVFPYLVDAERAFERGAPIPRPFQGFNALTHPILTLQADHGMMSREWQKIHEMTSGFKPRGGSGKGLKDLYQALKDLEMDNRKHMHLENNVLFHRAIQLGLLNGEEINEGHCQKTPHL